MKIEPRLGALAGLALTLIVAGVARADESEDRTIAAGKQRYMENCASCHGPDAKGAGTMASELKRVPADLTQLAKRNGGNFPFEQIYDMIDGRGEIGAHGTRDMPVWGYEYKMGVPTAAGMSEAVVRGKILELIVYLRSIQET